MLTINPPPVSDIAVAARAVRRVGPFRFTPIILSYNVSEVSSSEGASRLIPALLTSASKRPQRVTAASITRSSDVQYPT
jgi:hypothetical protein